MKFLSLTGEPVRKAIEAAMNAAFYNLISDSLSHPNLAELEELLDDPRGANAVAKARGGGLSTPGSFMGMEGVLDLFACARNKARSLRSTDPGLASLYARAAEMMEEAIVRAEAKPTDREAKSGMLVTLRPSDFEI